MLPIAEILAGVQDSLESLAGHAGLLIMNALLEDEVDQLVGERYSHNPDRRASRHGHDDGYIVFAGRKVPMKKPRVRSHGHPRAAPRLQHRQRGDRGLASPAPQ